ncbi:MAG: L-fucose:H+ symporter permease [Bacteroidales bacterium]|nr:L-fucose:H+ symporter permease [Bacteroidales bacterium]MBQ7468688.1 L-fucose:H+ symporter permease [Bacteroidales bacterium]MBQ8461880.1 L-fucose:H+ symporter permease [Bacteroidales bacterium]MDT3361577.1 L-fucose:H+ symporter permease [Bacteroidota bacterium]
MAVKTKLVQKQYLLPFILITTLFALWGFANDITNPMVAGFQTIMELSAAKASLIQFAFYGGYATMAIPAALFIRKYSHKRGIMLGLALYAAGAFLFIPAAAQQSFTFFCLSLYILTFGLAFLETTANPFVLSLGSKETSTRRLNLAQAFNPMGSLAGMAVASWVVLPNLLSDQHRDAAGQLVFSSLPEAQKAVERVHDIAIIRDAYVALGVIVLIVFVLIAITKMPGAVVKPQKGHTGKTLRNLWHNVAYREGVLAQVFYVAAQIMVWTFIIHYADNLGIDKATAQKYNIAAMALFLCFRFIATFLMKYINSRKLLTVFGAMAALCTLGTIFIVGTGGLICLVATSAFMSLMFPTIYGISLEGVDAEDSNLGAAFLVMAIVGGALLPPLQGSIIDLGTVGSLPAVNASFILPLICFLMVTLYGWRRVRSE